MQTAEAVRPLRGRRQLGDTKRGGVGHEDRAFGNDPLERRVRLLLLGRALDNRLDDQIALLQCVERCRARQVLERPVARLRAGLPFRHAIKT